MAAIDEILTHIENKKSFVLEAGAGSGKTYTLIQTLNYLIAHKGELLRKSGQRICCITYTNVAKNEINTRIENNDLVLVATIHEFLWGTIKQFQKQLKIELCNLNEVNVKRDADKGKTDSRYIEKLVERIDLIQGVSYNDTSFNEFEKGVIEHDDVIEISRMMYESYLVLNDIVAQKYPYLFVDEYQDTAVDTISCLIECLLKRNLGKIVIGFFGDSHQKIYDYGVGDLEKYYAENEGPVQLVKKTENYRSSDSVVKLLNNFRKNIKQIPQSGHVGTVNFFYWKNHPSKPKKDIRKFNAQVLATKDILYEGLIKKLELEGWSFSKPSKDRVLVLANSRVAQRAGFGNLFSTCSRRFGQSTKERLLDRNHPLINFFTGSIDKKTSQERKTGLEHLLSYWQDGNHNNVLRFIRRNGVLLNGEFVHSHKKHISKVLNHICDLRSSGTVKEVFEAVTAGGIIYSIRLNELIEKINRDLESVHPDDLIKHQRDKEFFESFMELPYSQISRFWEHVQKNTVFSTKHGTKGDEFRNVLTVIDDTEWPQEYNFKDFFNGTEENPNRFLRTRNLFYVECSRAIENLSVLCLSELDNAALENIESWFGDSNVIDIEEYLAS